MFTKQILHKGVLVLVSLLAFSGLMSCSSDDDENGPNLEPPLYSSVSGRYEITSPESSIRSVELTESGNYIIILNGAKYEAKQGSKARFLYLNKSFTRAISFNNMIHGQFTKVSDTEFILEGWGRIVLSTDSNGGTTITYTPNGGQSFTYPYYMRKPISDSGLTNALCRTWSIESLRLTYKVGKDTFNEKYKMSELSKLKVDFLNFYKKIARKYGADDEDIADFEEDWNEDFDELEYAVPNQVIFSKAGTYIVTYKGDSLAVSTWKWVDQNNKLIRYSWDYDDEYSYNVSGNVKIDFSGNQLLLIETPTDRDNDYDEDYDDPIVTATLTWYMNEVR